MNLFPKQRFTDIENKLMVTKGEEGLGGGVKSEIGINRYTRCCVFRYAVLNT